jgi:hypothetical protein
MIYSYSYSKAGSSHSKTGINQDAIKIEKLDNSIIIAAVADGVGSCKYSDIASHTAVDTAVKVCIEEINATDNSEEKQCDLLKVIEKSFARAELEIDKISSAKNHSITDYDTTLSLVIYDGKHITYGHCGDGGIIGLTSEGDYIKITSPQKTDGMFVIPLRKKDAWAFGKRDEDFAGILLATDGVYDTFFPYLLKGQDVEIYVPLAHFFMDNDFLKVTDESSRANIENERTEYLDSEACVSITDDKTLVVLINSVITPKRKTDDYYKEPDWETLQLKWNKKAYPHLYETKDAKNDTGGEPVGDSDKK